MAYATFAVAVSAAACHASSHPALSADVASPPLSAQAALARDIDAILSQPALERGYWGVMVKSLKNDETLFAVNRRKLMMPASKMKIVTLAAAAQTLGWSYAYETKVFALGAATNGVLDGDLVVVGSGDPSIGTADGMADRLFASWADRLKGAGIRTVAGRIIGDDRRFDGEEVGFGWSWDDLQDDYAAGVSALQFNENMARVTVRPGPAVGDYAAVSVSPAHSGLVVRSTARTIAADADAGVHVRRVTGNPTLELTGMIALASEPRVLSVSVDNPTLFFVDTMRAALIANGIDVHGAAVDIKRLPNPPVPSAAPLAIHTSPPLSTLAMRLMKMSQNQYAETFLRTMGGESGLSNAESGRRFALRTLEAWGVQPSDLIQRDGSGLSRYDYVTPDALVTILAHVNRDDTLRGPFELSLPIAGRDGSLANRMKGTPAEGNARAKTGSMSNVRGLSGYVTTADGEPLVFAVIANNFDAAPSVITTTADAIVVRLAQFSR